MLGQLTPLKKTNTDYRRPFFSYLGSARAVSSSSLNLICISAFAGQEAACSLKTAVKQKNSAEQGIDDGLLQDQQIRLHQHHHQLDATSSKSEATTIRKSAKVSNASTVSNVSSTLTVPIIQHGGLSDDEGTYQALSVVFVEDAAVPDGKGAKDGSRSKKSSQKRKGQQQGVVVHKSVNQGEWSLKRLALKDHAACLIER